MLCAPLFHVLPPVQAIGFTALLAVCGLFSRRLRPLSWLVLACCWALMHYQARLDDRLPASMASQAFTLTGTVVSIPSSGPELVRFRFMPDPELREKGWPEILLLSWFRKQGEKAGETVPFREPGAGERWRFEIKAKPPWGPVNFQGADRERWLFAQGIGASGTVRDGWLLALPEGFRYAVSRVRAAVIQAISRAIGDENVRGVIQALATADRSGLATADRELLTATGTAHLLAISGLHVGLAAAGGMWAGRILLLAVPMSWLGGASLAVTAGAGLLSAFAYAALAGFGTPTLRSALMLFTAMAAILLCRSIHPARAWAVSLAVILLIDPFAPLGAGAWFSFLAVAALLWMFQPRTGTIPKWKALLLAQFAVILVLIPVSAAWFGVFSPSAFVANLVAIPWVSFGVVPAVLLGITVLPFSEWAAGVSWNAAGLSVSTLFQVLEHIRAIQGQVWFLPPATRLQAALGLCGALLCLMPRGFRARWLGLFLMAPLFFPPAPKTANGDLYVEVLDAGQGTAVLVGSGRHTLLYDTGPGDGRERNLVSGVITPALAAAGPGAPGRVIVSHADLDHAGGLGTLERRYPDAVFAANLRSDTPVLDRCTAPESWEWGNVRLKTLHPSPWLPYLGNDSSCVVSVASAGGRILLSGDISRTVESRLLQQGIGPHALLLVPHHGSATSSSQAFIERVDPRIAIATASLGNRFGFPKDEIRARYESAGTRFWSTGDCGAVKAVLARDGSLNAASARRARNRAWRWPAAENCP